ncbi:nucleoside phosphorylase [Paenibacillus sp. MSJ-34]|uniref:nucleoside phosphorylase n=1 Tax=Paenibacillus sp. MSJ-34 TaxID=2841529 RepID=UPI001C121402|nr:nucleoside phosphorylase [Paenibacillus sp. MSJ-34]
MTNFIQPHIRIGADSGAEYAILPGDPGRVATVARFLERPRELMVNREYRTVSGWYKGVKVLVTSTGIGGPSLGIAVEELKNIGVTTMIRIGSCGALRQGLRLGDLVIAAGAVRDDGTSAAFVESSYPAIPDYRLLHRLNQVSAELHVPRHCGIVRSHDSFYTEREDDICRYWGSRGVLAADMETAALFVIGGINGLRVASILNVVVEAGGDVEKGINEYVNADEACKQGEEREIEVALETIASIDKLK